MAQCWGHPTFLLRLGARACLALLWYCLAAAALLQHASWRALRNNPTYSSCNQNAMHPYN